MLKSYPNERYWKGYPRPMQELPSSYVRSSSRHSACGVQLCTGPKHSYYVSPCEKPESPIIRPTSRHLLRTMFVADVGTAVATSEAQTALALHATNNMPRPLRSAGCSAELLSADPELYPTALRNTRFTVPVPCTS